MKPLSADWKAIREQCAEVLWREVSAPSLPVICRRLGLDPSMTDADPMASKRSYVASLTDGLSNTKMLELARRIVEDFPDFHLLELVRRLEERGRPAVSETTRRKIVAYLDTINLSGNVDVVELLAELWPLNKMDGTGAYKGVQVTYGALDAEIYQHYVRFEDWSTKDLLEILDLYRCSNVLLFEFLAMIVHPRTREEADQREMARSLTEILRRDSFALAQAGTVSGYPIFKVAPVASIGESPSSQEVSIVLGSFDEEGVHAAWQKAMARKNTDPEGAITAARTLLETVCKHVLDHCENASYQPGDDLPKLWKACAETLNLAPSQHTLEPFKQVLGGCTSVVHGLGTVRNRIGDAHGQGRRPVKPKPRHAALAVDLAGAMANFIVTTFNERSDSVDGRSGIPEAPSTGSGHPS